MDVFEGIVINTCFNQGLDFNNTFIVVVTGDKINFCGHLILLVGGKYFHIAGLNAYPHMMDEAGYTKYLLQSGKKQIRSHKINISNFAAAQIELERQLSGKWTWVILFHNCESFVLDIIQAGTNGSKIMDFYDMYLKVNCPRLDY